MSRLRIVVVSFACSCHLAFPHAPPERGRDAAHDLRAREARAPDLAPGANLLPLDLTRADVRPDRSHDLRAPDLAPPQGKTCQTPDKTAWFSANAPPTPGATLSLKVCITWSPGPTWVLAGVKDTIAAGKGSCCAGCYVGKVSTNVTGCPSGTENAWQVMGVQVPKTAGPFAFSLLKDCVNDNCNAVTCTEVAWCKP